jgi:hypothetical protein
MDATVRRIQTHTYYLTSGPASREPPHRRPAGPGLVPDDEPTPDEAPGLEHIGRRGELPPVGEDADRGARLRHAEALAQPERAPIAERPLVPVVAPELGPLYERAGQRVLLAGGSRPVPPREPARRGQRIRHDGVDAGAPASTEAPRVPRRDARPSARAARTRVRAERGKGRPRMRARSRRRRSLEGEHRSALAQRLGELDGLRRRVRPASEHFVRELDGSRRENLVHETHRESSRLAPPSPSKRTPALKPTVSQGSTRA